MEYGCGAGKPRGPPAGFQARKHDMSSFPPAPRKPASTLTDPRSTGAPPRPALADLLGLRGTKTR